jgi:hypothetical protein
VDHLREVCKLNDTDNRKQAAFSYYDGYADQFWKKFTDGQTGNIPWNADYNCHTFTVELLKSLGLDCPEGLFLHGAEYETLHSLPHSVQNN